MGITAHEYAINEPVVTTLNNIKPKADTYKDTEDYNAERTCQVVTLKNFNHSTIKSGLLTKVQIPAGS